VLLLLLLVPRPRPCHDPEIAQKKPGMCSPTASPSDKQSR
jgi:hypothetical protein